MSGLLILTISTITLVSCSEEGDINTREGFKTKADSGGILFGIGIGRASLGCERIGLCKVNAAKVTFDGISVDITKLAPIKQVNVIIPSPPGPGGTPTPPRPGPSNRTDGTSLSDESTTNSALTSGVASVIRIEFFDHGLESSRPNLTYAQSMFGGNNILLQEPFIFDTTIWSQKNVKVFTSNVGSFPITLDPTTGRYGFTLTGILQ
jgi:hypothetical protein